VLQIGTRPSLVASSKEDQLIRLARLSFVGLRAGYPRSVVPGSCAGIPELNLRSKRTKPCGLTLAPHGLRSLSAGA